ncbi:NAD-dependent epimerase/dehydratase family protein [Wukongibacter baidiensis]|uniref:NAD-dependent epimerase/dehydratase family protein n=1 Tax=Wukongibacter baidiensis TaxID=1723361 RepID=UPI003D7F99C9
MIKVIVTGATGFIGSNLVRKLVDQHYDVYIICRKTSRLHNISSYLNKIDIYRYDNNLSNLIGYFNEIKPDCIFHLASSVIVEHKPEDIDNLINSNLRFSTHILEAMLQSGAKKIINTGTSWQHYENKKYNPVCLYAATKEAFEKLLEYYIEAENFKAITLKLFDTYGESDTRGKLINLLSKYSKDKKILEMSSSNQVMDLVHVDDVTEAYFKAYEYLNKKIDYTHEKFAVSSRRVITLKELIEIYEKVAEKKLNIRWGAKPPRKREVFQLWSDYSLVPNWETTLSLEEGLKRFE